MSDLRKAAIDVLFAIEGGESFDTIERLANRLRHALSSHEVKIKPTHTTGITTFLDPAEVEPPIASKILMLTPGRVCIVGPWSDWAVGWHPLPRIPKTLRWKGPGNV